MSPSLPGWLLQSGLPAVSSNRVTEQRPWVQRVTAHGGLHKMHVSSGAVMGVRPQEAPKWVEPWFSHHPQSFMPGRLRLAHT